MFQEMMPMTQGGGGEQIPLLPPGYYSHISGVAQLSSNVANGGAGYSSAIFVNITDLGYTSVTVSQGGSGAYMYKPTFFKKDGTYEVGAEIGAYSKSLSLTSDIAYIFLSGGNSSGSGALTMTFS